MTTAPLTTARRRRSPRPTTPTPADPWSQLADQLAKVRAEVVTLHRLAQTIATHGPVACTDPSARTLLSTRQADHLARVGSRLLDWEQSCRNEAARLTTRTKDDR